MSSVLPWVLGMLSATCFIGGMVVARWRLATVLAGHQQWHEFQLSAIRERIAALEIVVHSAYPDQFERAQIELRKSLNLLSSNPGNLKK